MAKVETMFTLRRPYGTELPGIYNLSFKCPAAWHKVTRIIIYKDGTFTVYEQNIQDLAIEMFNALYDLLTPDFQNYFS